MAQAFIPGIQLSEAFYREAVRPILDTDFPGLAHAAALIGAGSEVLGYDDAMSSDHDWGPRVLLFVDEPDHQAVSDAVRLTLAGKLPPEFRGHPTSFTEPDRLDNGTQQMVPVASGMSINHRVTIQTMQEFTAGYLGIDLGTDSKSPIEPADWLTLPEQRLRSVTSGAVFHDGIGLARLRSRLEYYPHDIWLYLLSCGWARIGQEEHLMGRAGSCGDEIGSALIGARLVRDIMRLCFLMQRTYAPYSKWLGRDFQALPCAPDFLSHLERALGATDWESRQQHLVLAYEALARLHNSLGVIAPMPESVTSFFDRPFQVMAIHGFSDALIQEVSDPQVAQIAKRSPIGNIDQFSDSTDLLSDTLWRPLLRQLYLG
jgi:hypothetical protein